MPQRRPRSRPASAPLGVGAAALLALVLGLGNAACVAATAAIGSDADSGGITLPAGPDARDLAGIAIRDRYLDVAQGGSGSDGADGEARSVAQARVVEGGPDPNLTFPPEGTPLLGVHAYNGQPQEILRFIRWLDGDEVEEFTEWADHADDSGTVQGYQDVIRREVGWEGVEMDTPWDRFVIRNMRDFVLAKPGRFANWSMAIIPDSHWGQLREGAAGDFDHHFTNLANALAAQGLADPAIPVIFRPGYEWDAGWFPWGVDNNLTRAKHFAEFWRRIVTAMREAQPDANWMFDWNPNQDAYWNRELLEAAWPGGGYVDFIGIDIYDRGGNHRPCDDVGPRWRWAESLLNRARDFAISKGKPLTIPEWGIWNSGCDPNEWGSGIDNPYHIERMHDWITANAEHIHYHIYFNEMSRHRLDAETPNPLSGARFRELFGPSAE